MNEITQLLLLKDVIYDRTKNGNTPAHLAALYGHLQVVKLFISEFNFDPNTPGPLGRPLLHAAAQEGHMNVVKYLIEELKCDPSCCPGEEKATPLHLASSSIWTYNCGAIPHSRQTVQTSIQELPWRYSNTSVLLHTLVTLK